MSYSKVRISRKTLLVIGLCIGFGVLGIVVFVLLITFTGTFGPACPVGDQVCLDAVHSALPVDWNAVFSGWLDDLKIILPIVIGVSVAVSLQNRERK